MSSKVLLNTPEQRLLHIISWKFGGPTKIGRLIEKKTGIKTSRQTFINWSIRGKVRLKYVGIIAELLKVDPLCLNYGEYIGLSKKKESFEEVVDSCKLLTTDEKRYVLTGKSYEH